MKKFLSLILALTMVISCLVVLSVTVNAADGDWEVYASGSDHDPNNTAPKRSIPGKQYGDDGLTMVAPEGLWEDFTPYGTFETKTPVNLRQNFYMKVRVNDFTYKGDLWHAFHVKQYPVVNELKDNEYNPGFQASMRLDVADDGSSTIRKNWNVPYWTTTKTPQQVAAVSSSSGWNDDYEVGPNGEYYPVYTFEVKYHDIEGYSVYINGVELEGEFMEKMTETIEDANGLMYVGFALQNGTKGGTVSCTILEYSMNGGEVKVPEGTDNTAEIKRENKYTVKDGSDVAAGQPAISLKGYTDSWKNIYTNGTYNLLESGYVNSVQADKNFVWVFGSVQNNVGIDYSIEDFPVAIAIFKNLCTCEWDPEGGENLTPDQADAECTCDEKLNANVLAGDIIAYGGATIQGVAGLDEPITDEENNLYNYWIFDHTDMLLEVPELAENGGRIHGMRIDISGMRNAVGEAYRNEYDVIEIAYFASVEDAEAYFEALAANDFKIELDNVETPTTPTDTTAAPSEITTEAPAQVTTEAPAQVTTEAPVQVTTEAPAQVTTEAPTQEPTEAPTQEPTEAPKVEETEPTTQAPQDEPNDEGGCGGVVGVGAIAVVAIAAAGLISFKKKED